ncbi:MAG: hypothetical protein RIM84_08790 [Alphaproteobacteria bacterium]
MPKTPLLALAVLVALAGPAAADDGGKSLERDMKRVEEIARRAAEQLIGSIGAMIGAVPQFEAPEVLDNGDIIIRRKHDDAPPPEPQQKPRRRPGPNDPRHQGSTDI